LLFQSVFTGYSIVQIQNIVMQKSKRITLGQLLPFLTLVFFGLSMTFQSCKKETAPGVTEDVAGKKPPKNPPPPPPAPFYFANCSWPVYSGVFRLGEPCNVSITMNYINSPGGSYSAFSTTINGITFAAPAGTFNTGSGTIVFTATGTPNYAGQFGVTLSLGNIIPCSIFPIVLNPIPDPATCGGEPGAAVGSTGCVTFNYRGQQVTYITVRAADGKVWLKHNLGSPQVAYSAWDQASFGDYFQWGRWDDGHQLINSPMTPTNSALQNPSHIPGGNPNYINSDGSSSWWGTGLATDTWTNAPASASNGISPCAALGPGWRLPTITDWQNVVNAEGITSALDAYSSRLSLPAAGYRAATTLFGGGNYWSSTAASNGTGYFLTYDESNYQVWFQATYRGLGQSCRCVKD
jgi:hypothetical protein